MSIELSTVPLVDDATRNGLVEDLSRCSTNRGKLALLALRCRVLSGVSRRRNRRHIMNRLRFLRIEVSDHEHDEIGHDIRHNGSLLRLRALNDCSHRINYDKELLNQAIHMPVYVRLYTCDRLVGHRSKGVGTIRHAHYVDE